MVFESQTLSQETKKAFYRNILYADEVGKRERYGVNGAVKTHAWFVKAVFGSMEEDPPKVNVAGPRIFNDADDPFFGFSADGKVGMPNVLSALPNDPHIDRLLHLFSDNEVVGNIILAARRLWYRGFDGRWEDLPTIPSGRLFKEVIDELTRDMDKDTALCVCRNFLLVQAKYLSKKLEPIVSAEPGVKRDGLDELMCYLVDRLPLRGRDDLIKIKAEVFNGSQTLKDFVGTERERLRGMMAVSTILECENKGELDDESVDVRYALGFGSLPCIQADFLIPAMLSMANELDLKLSVIPNSSPKNRPVTLSAAATDKLLRNLQKLAIRYNLDQGTAEKLVTNYNNHMHGVDKEAPDHDLRVISFCLNVSNTAFFFKKIEKIFKYLIIFVCCLMQIEEKGIEKNGNVKITKRDYRRNINRKIPDPNQSQGMQKRYQLLNTWLTDGVRAFRLVADTSQSRRSQPAARPAEIGNKLDFIRDEAKASGPLSHFGAIVGLDPGQVCACAAFAFPMEPQESASQLKIKQGFLYGRQRRNARWLEDRKVREGIAYLEEGLSKETRSKASLQSYLGWVRVWQQEQRLTRIPDFYNSLAVAHRRWDSKMSECSAVDKAAELIERLPGLPVSVGAQDPKRRRHERDRPAKPTLFIVGNGAFPTNSRGMVPSRHNKLMQVIMRRAKKSRVHMTCIL